jgi:autophagy-related protein 9
MIAGRRNLRGHTSAGSILGTSILAQGPSASSIFGGGMSTAQTAILGESAQSITDDNDASGTRTPRGDSASAIPDEDLAGDGGVGSGLGDSYVDGGKRSHKMDIGDEPEEEVRDGGMLGLLAQIYGQRDGPGAARGRHM